MNSYLEYLGVDIDKRKYSVSVSKVSLLAVRRVTIDASPVRQGFVDRWGGTYTVENPTKSHTEALLSGAPLQTGIRDIDRANTDQRTSAVVSLNEAVELYALDDDIRFEKLDDIKKLHKDLDDLYTLLYEEVEDSFSEDPFELKTLLKKLTPLLRAVKPLAKAWEAKVGGNIATGVFANALKVSVRQVESGKVDGGVSIKEATSDNSDIFDEDGNMMFDF